MNPKLIQAARQRVGVDDKGLVTAGNFKTPEQLQAAAAKMFEEFQSRLKGLPPLGIAMRESRNLEKANSMMEEAKSLEDMNAAFSLCSRSLEKLLSSATKPSGENQGKIKALIKATKEYGNYWDDDLSSCLFVGTDLAAFLVLAGLIARGDFSRAERHIDRLDTVFREALPDSVLKLFGWE